MTGAEWNACALFICGVVLLFIIYLINVYINR